jgi:hypothetical protein
MSIIQKLQKLSDPVVVKKNVDHLLYKAKVSYWLARKPAMPDPAFVVGCSRAGTTVTFETIRKSSKLLSFPYEIPQFWHSLVGPWDKAWDSEATDVNDAKPEHRNRSFAHFYARLGQGWILDKSCINTIRIPYLHSLFPNAYFIYIQRDGRDNISSMMEGWRQRGRFDLAQYLGKLPETVAIENGEFQDWCFFLPPGWRDYNRASLREVCAHQWITANRMALDAKKRIPADRWIHLRYEDLFSRPEAMFGEVFERLGLPFEDAALEHCRNLDQRPTSIVSGPPKQEKWRQQNPREIERILDQIEPLQAELGYA